MTDDATRKRKFEAQEDDAADSATESESDSSWAPSSAEEEGEEEGEEPSPPVVSTYRTRSRGPAPPKPEDIDATMDRADEVVNNESDFSSTTSEEEEEEEEESVEEEEEEEEEDTEDDGYSDDDSFVTSEEGDEEEEEEEEDDTPSEDKPAVEGEVEEGPSAMEEDHATPPVVEIDSAPSTNASSSSSTVEVRAMHTISF